VYPYIHACNAHIGSISEIKTLAFYPRNDWAHPFPTYPNPQIKTFFPEINLSVALFIPSTQECLQP